MITNRTSWARSGSALSRSSTGSSTGCGSWAGWSVIALAPRRPAWRPPVVERRDAFAPVGGERRLRQAWSSRPSPVARSVSKPSPHRPLGRPQADRGLRRDLIGQLPGRRACRPGGYAPVGQPDIERLGRRHPAAGQDQVQRPVQPDAAGQQLGPAATGHQPQPHLRQPEDRVVGGDDRGRRTGPARSRRPTRTRARRRWSASRPGARRRRSRRRPHAGPAAGRRRTRPVP